MSEKDNPASAAAKIGENMAAQFANAAGLYGGAFAGSLKAVQDYQAKLLHFFQSNAEANMQLAQKLMQVETVSSHMRERAAVIGDQAKELATLGQEAAKKAVEAVTQTKST